VGKEKLIGFWWGDLKEGVHLKNLGVNGNISDCVNLVYVLVGWLVGLLLDCLFIHIFLARVQVVS
jgi:hypothetical protein